ncbi:MAG: ABC transporter ATP-binding protein [Desulfatiglans sp.]|nr:ABC transporter ATP-binding protein [Thermodesulfobacteriota bacterium]MEE4351572.1 ABC transporter ATP-binding protein [Desulfatiglans sp.]
MYLEVKEVTLLYDRAMVLNNVSLHVDKGAMVSLVGPNGAGKTTLLRAIVGLVRWEKRAFRGTTGGKITIEGSIRFDGKEISDLPPNKIVKSGLVLCPERGRPFVEMTIRENLEAGAYLLSDKGIMKDTLERVYQLFPILKQRESQISGTISGGERTMLAIGRSLMSQARLLLIDEPSVGLAPKVKEDLFERIKVVHDMGITVLLTEQDIGFAFDLAERNYVLSQGQIKAEGTPDELLADEIVRKSYLGL